MIDPAESVLDPLKALGSALLGVEKPGRYVGGEYGRLAKADAPFRMAVAFPDLYEIGMSNQAIRILYNRANALEGISCDRVFAPAPDFEALLAQREVPLYTLDLGTPLRLLDLLGFSLGYELGINGVLAILQAGRVPIRSSDRREDHPLIIMGGPAASNPAPFARFADAFWVGEAEDRFFEVLLRLRDAKGVGAGRGELLSILAAEPSVWMPGKKARRAVDADFAREKRPASVFPVPSIRIVQDHGSVEIMRGCPNGCRFCHAGIWYRPMRQKSGEQVRAEVDDFVRLGGYREITLASLSTGDYKGIASLIRGLNAEYSDRRISFQLPSLKVSSFSLPLIESVSETRKSGLTFAIETPLDAWQLSINKEVARQAVIDILTEAKHHGWKSAKFYFMIGLPIGDYKNGYGRNNEEKEIVDFLVEIKRRTGVGISVNVGTFVPKPHTPYQWVPQIDERTALEKLMYIKNALRPLGFKVSTHDTFVSLIEGVISRGDERVGELIEKAFSLGCRLDAWDDYIQKDHWRALFAEHQAAVADALGGRPLDQELPWSSIDCGTGIGFLKREFQRSEASQMSAPCAEDCGAPCGACSDDVKIVENIIHNEVEPEAFSHADATAATARATIYGAASVQARKSLRMLFSFEKTGAAVFVPHLGLIELFSKSFIRSGLPIHYTEGFNPLPKMDFASPLSMGIASLGEIASVDLDAEVDADRFVDDMNAALPSGFRLTRARMFAIPEGTKKHSTPSLLWGFAYLSGNGADGIDPVPAAEEKAYRRGRMEDGTTYVLELCRASLYARGEDGEPADYFSIYDKLYPR